MGLCVCADTLGGGRWPVLRFDPISLVLAQRNGVEWQDKLTTPPNVTAHTHKPKEKSGNPKPGFPLTFSLYAQPTLASE